MRLPFVKQYTVRCPDGTERTIHRNVDEILPLFIPGWSANASATATGSGQAVGLDEISGELKGEYANKIQGLLFSINESNQAIMMQFRAVYLAFVSDPCNSSGFLRRQVENLNAQYHSYSKLRIQVHTLIELVRNRPDDTLAILDMFAEIAGKVGGAPARLAISHEIGDNRNLAKEWAETRGR